MSETNSIEAPPGFVVREEAHKAAYENGFRIELGVRDGWIGYRSATARGEIWVSRGADKGSWLMSISHAGVAAELGLPTAEPIVGPGFATFAFAHLHELYGVLARVYKLGVSLPDVPLKAFEKATFNLPRNTEAERLTVERIGQNFFRQALIEYWNGRLPPDRHYRPGTAARLSHRPLGKMRNRRSTSQRPQRPAPLCPLGRRLRRGPSQHRRHGTVLRFPELTAPAVAALGLDSALPLVPLTDFHRTNLAYHRAKHTF